MSADPIELKSRVARVLNEKVRPALAMDGIQFEVLDVVNRIARLRLQGSCTGCPGTIMAVIMGIEQELRKHEPEIEYVEVVG